jgi:antibiotic biosynthesis monooxygenase (ABM) superfamily enzyme
MSTQRKTQIWQQRTLSTIFAWAAAFGVVSALQLACGKWLQSLPEAVHILILTGVLVTVMGNVVMPFISKLVARISS